MMRFRITRAIYKSLAGSDAKEGVAIVSARARRNVVFYLAGLCVKTGRE